MDGMEGFVVVKGKVKFGYPPFVMPVSLVGANVGGKPNFEAIAWFSLFWIISRV